MTTEEIIYANGHEYVNDAITNGFPRELGQYLYDAYLAGASDAYYLANEE